MWSIIFVLPNISLKEAVGNENIAIAPHDDSRASADIARSPFGKSLVENFEDQFGRKIHPSLLIINDDASDSIRAIEAIVSFRNAIALSTIIRGYEHRLTSTFVAFPLYSDYFDFYPITISKKHDGFITRSPSILGFDAEYQEFRGQTSPGLSGGGSLSVKPDDQLFGNLKRVWERRFLRGKIGEWSTTALFRSLEMAYQATTMPYKNHSTIYDYGSSASLWVSAFEIISHPRQGKASLLTVIDLLGDYQWYNKVLERKVYKIRYAGQNHKVNLVQRLYKELYDTRNNFLHGNPVKMSRLYPFKNPQIPPITMFAPLIYKVALISFLNRFKSKRRKKRMDGLLDYADKFIAEGGLVRAILKSKGR